MNEQPADQSSQYQRWADSVVAGLQATTETDQALIRALHGAAVLSEEIAFQRADAIRAAALGLPPAACAAAAGISAGLFADWCARDPAFRSAVDSAKALADTHGSGAAVSAGGLRLVLNAIKGGASFADATALIGVSLLQFRRLREENPKIHALVDAASSMRRRQKTGSAKKRSTHKGYRLVRRDGT
ncbi:hypothetical protein [Streptomyces tubercidicus]|uniref:hypothetical protein n=1 Tax=Streptomyces tubercidicus TaxID=47759 RepID=UPI0034666147